MPEARPETRADYAHFLTIPTRWMDNDVYGHVNNAVYYAYFDTVINRYLMNEGGLDVSRSSGIGLCVESHCCYLRPVAFPGDLDAGLRVEHLGRSSVRYGVGIFEGAADDASAHGWFVHVFVDRATRRSTPVDGRIRSALERIVRVAVSSGHRAPRR
jgi:acyl-CoA thioester hydrolase